MVFSRISATTCLRLAAIALGVGLAFESAVAQNSYPNRPIKIIVPVPPGATADTLPRVVGEQLSLRWGQPVVIENRAGASNNLGAEMVARAEPDGYTLLATPPGPLVIAKSMNPKLSFEPSAFVPVTVLATLPNTLVARPNFPGANLTQLVVNAKSSPGKFNYASAGIGSTPHLAAEALQLAAGIKLTHIPYKGLAPALTDVLAGHVDMMFDNIGNTLRHIRDGRVKGIAVAGSERVPDLPDVPTLAETFPGFYSTTWFAIVAPPKTPPEIAAKLSAAIAEILKIPSVAAKFKELSCTPVGNSPAEMSMFLKEETERWQKVIATAGVKPE